MLVGYTEWPKEFADHYRDEGCWLGETFGGVLKERAEEIWRSNRGCKW